LIVSGEALSVPAGRVPTVTVTLAVTEPAEFVAVRV
jgi:hypothetical protein